MGNDPMINTVKEMLQDVQGIGDIEVDGACGSLDCGACAVKKVLGNTQYRAQVIADSTSAAVFRIELQTVCSTNHTTLVAQNSREKKNRARPALGTQFENFDDYDTVFIGYQNWWGDMPMVRYIL